MQYTEMRNSRGCDYLFVGSGHPLHAMMKGLYDQGCHDDKYHQVDPALAYGMSGGMCLDEKCKPGKMLV